VRISVQIDRLFGNVHGEFVPRLRDQRLRGFHRALDNLGQFHPALPQFELPRCDARDFEQVIHYCDELSSLALARS
jgi:hypothetical protein